ncbi:MAG: hypothetical protein HUJ27_03175 [Rhodobacteraceae bacterium]|nr:hypothetical protein [Paracoccaceae bacterium]
MGRKNTQLDLFPPCFSGVIIRAPIEDVLPILRGDFLQQKVNREKLQDYPEMCDVIVGTDAIEDKGKFGYLLPMQDGTFEQSEGDFDVWGYCRVSRIRGAKNLSFLEFPENGRPLVYDLVIAQFLGVETFYFRSEISACGEIDGIDPRAWKSLNEFFYHNYSGGRLERISFSLKDHHRAVESGVTHGGRRSGRVSGSAAWFEDVNRDGQVPKRPILNRSKILKYIVKFGVDPEAIFLSKELDDTFLFTAGREGEPLTNFEEDMARLRIFQGDFDADASQNPGKLIFAVDPKR